jgi:hypothetical protein
MTPYNVILHISGVAALGGLSENRDFANATMSIALAPILIGAQRWEFKRLRTQARRNPTWWNRRLRPASN